MDRYEARWNNGFWKVFDTYRYTSVYVTSLDRGLFRLQGDAKDAAAGMNAEWKASGKKWRH
jgi:hypothetical protein